MAEDKTQVTVSRDTRGNWVYTFWPQGTTADVLNAASLDFKQITRTVSSIKTWLKTSPTAEEAELVAEYERENDNRTSAVGESGCLTLYLSGE